MVRIQYPESLYRKYDYEVRIAISPKATSSSCAVQKKEIAFYMIPRQWGLKKSEAE